MTEAIPARQCHICGEIDLCRYKFIIHDLAKNTEQKYYLCTTCASDLELRYDFNLDTYYEPPDVL